MLQQTITHLFGVAYVATEGDTEDYWLEGEPVHLEVERTDGNEVRIGVRARGEHTDAASIYLTRSQATELVMAIAAAAMPPSASAES